MKRLVFFALFSMGAMCKPIDKPLAHWDSDRVLRDLQMFASEPHPMGSPRNAALADYIEKEMTTVGLATRQDKFEVEVPDPELLRPGANVSMMQKTTVSKSLANVSAKLNQGKKNCVFLVASHYDSKVLEGRISIGANDSGSSSAALLELMRGLKESQYKFRCHVEAIWFDGEEAYLENWRDGELNHPARIIDNTYGSRHYVENLTLCEVRKHCNKDGEVIEGLILIDMIGSPDLKLSLESNSTPELMTLARELDKILFNSQLYGSSSFKAIEDDHIPFVKNGIPAIDLIGFETLEHWHQSTDTIDKVSVKSMEQAARLVEEMLKKILLDD